MTVIYNSLAVAVLSLVFVTSSAFSLLHTNHNLSTHPIAKDKCPQNGVCEVFTSSTKLRSIAADKDSESAVSENVSSLPQRSGKFQSDVYDKPVVVLGCSSGDGNELSRLAEAFTKSHGAASPLNGLECDLPTANAQGITNAVLLDFKDTTMDASAVADVARKYYDNDFLVIYVNVQNESGKLEESFIHNSDYELCIKPEDKTDEESWDNVEWQLELLLARAFLPLAVPGSDSPSYNSATLTMGQNAFFLSLSFPEITDAEPYIEAMCQDNDAMEFRSDLLACRDDRFETLYSLQKIRQMCRPHATRAPMLPYLGSVIDDSLPVVYTVRTAHQAGTYPDDEEGIVKMFDLLQLGLRGAAEVLDVESAWDAQMTDAILAQVEQKYATQILGSHHVVGEQVSDEEALAINRRCALGGRAHGAKVVLSMEEGGDDHQAYKAAQASRDAAKEAGDPLIPHISLILGEKGQYSRVLNLPFTPVTHESLPFVAAPGQMSASELMTTRLIMGLVPPMKYGILGHNISYSVSPAMQGAAFAAARLPHSYSLIDMESVEEFVNSDFWDDDVFGGCSVTIPHKQAIIPHLDSLTDAAQTIGAVNTVIVKKPDDDQSERTLIGDNTDWKGIYNPLNRKLGGSASSSEGKVGVALILGGGGTARAAAYAATQLGLEKIYYNRTPSKAQDLADTFGGRVAISLNEDDSDAEETTSFGSLLKTMHGETRVVISTLPAAAEFELPSWFVENAKDSDKIPIIFDVNYKPYWTKLLHQGDDNGFPIVRGSEMLWEQGVGQFELWTGRTAPYKVMKAVVLENCLPENE
mmetsp:Transcript_12708/g.18475  ORF Transcript_12708/g.18475 Transcript_12708/m.18475 type:complete len:810 (+) Transcript_12708:170-2599(+)